MGDNLWNVHDSADIDKDDEDDDYNYANNADDDNKEDDGADGANDDNDNADGDNDDNDNADKNDLDLGKLELFRAMFCSQRRGGAVSHLGTGQLMKSTEKKYLGRLSLPSSSL